MDNQHKLISGYRDLTQEEIATINAVKRNAEAAGQQIKAIRSIASIDQRWVSIAETHLQQGYMALIRAIAQPTTF